jgi:hypothetical protein
MFVGKFYTRVFPYSSLFLWQRGERHKNRMLTPFFSVYDLMLFLWSSQLCSGVHCSWLWNLDKQWATKGVVSGISAIKSYWKSRAASNSSCIFLVRDPSLQRATNSCNRSRASQTRSYKTMSTSYHIYRRQLWTLVKWPQKEADRKYSTKKHMWQMDRKLSFYKFLHPTTAFSVQALPKWTIYWSWCVTSSPIN